MLEKIFVLPMILDDDDDWTGGGTPIDQTEGGDGSSLNPATGGNT